MIKALDLARVSRTACRSWRFSPCAHRWLLNSRIVTKTAGDTFEGHISYSVRDKLGSFSSMAGSGGKICGNTGGNSTGGDYAGSSAGSVLVNEVQQPSELVAIVDKDNNVIGAASRKEMREQNLIHRASFVIVKNSQDQIFVQKRVAFKETFPGHFDPAPGGVVGAHEDYESNAVRELQEEMGISGVSLTHHFDFFYESSGMRLWGALFSCTYDGELVLQPEEVESGRFMSRAELDELLHGGEPICPDSKQALLQYLDT